ncbi:hypothetical protein ACRALDRAFT_209853 [Sodiomyces alcalophilus JCM 7366]|uniref:uncharacterized protein n=1 Tax=Sodiomyces alcalophilus JCM 7366 TaxID=591952 RepID=UPI0039B5DAE2
MHGICDEFYDVHVLAVINGSEVITENYDTEHYTWKLHKQLDTAWVGPIFFDMKGAHVNCHLPTPTHAEYEDVIMTRRDWKATRRSSVGRDGARRTPFLSTLGSSITPMTSIPEMDEFVDWDKAGASTGASLDPLATSAHQDIPTDPDLDLVLANVDDDDWSFWALQHFNDQATQEPSLDIFEAGASFDQANFLPDPHPEPWWSIPDAPCTNCTLGRYQCKRIKEGQYKNYCTSCVALRCECSLASAISATQPTNATVTDMDTQLLSLLPLNPWPTAGEHPNAIPQEDLNIPGLHDASHPDLPSAEAVPSSNAAGVTPGSSSTSQESVAVLAGAGPGAGPGSAGPNKNSPPPKIGARFSRESVKILKNWLLSHNRHPYPSDEEKEMLQRQTGLNKTQISNWLANGRRRGKVQHPRSTSPHVRNTYSGPVDIPRRPGTPALESNMRHMNPLERWVDSPPENEPASVTAIARAVASNSSLSSGLTSPYSFAFTDDGSNRSLCNASSASSIGTSSGGSFISAFSYGSHGSFGSFGSANTRGRRRRRRPNPKRADPKTSLTTPRKTFQCTFCTEMFRTKHDWQRHEKSLHLSLERWVCSPNGPRAAIHPTLNQPCCVFCGEPNPDDAHIESHNHSTCQERSLDERTFYRKDHLNQHLRLVHNVRFLDWCMKSWKVATPEIRSRCGFCGIVMDTWSFRVDHLAEHFKTGNTMADWKGDWGFEAPVLEMVENSIPPCTRPPEIPSRSPADNERNSPLPYVAGGAPAESPRSAYELIKIELVHFMMNHEDRTGTLPDDYHMQLEACRIIFASEVLSLQGIDSNFSWLRDLLMSSEDIARQAQFGPLRTAIESRLSILKINGKDNLFEQCPLEKHLREYVRTKSLLGLTAMDEELQEEACRTVGRIEEVSTSPSDLIANWLVRLINSSTAWLANFRQRAHLPRTEDIVCAHLRSTDSTQIDSTIHNYSRLETELGLYMDAQKASGVVEPSDEDLQRQARIIIYDFDDGWNQTAADNAEWLRAFRQRHCRVSQADALVCTNAGGNSAVQPLQQQQQQQQQLRRQPQLAPQSLAPNPTDLRRIGGHTRMSQQAVSSLAESGFKTGTYFLNDANCYRRLAYELSRYVVAAMSPNNPNQHVPSDEELQHQARFKDSIALFCCPTLTSEPSDDPWNQTAADNAEWLQRFKRQSGIITTGPGLPEGDQWSLAQGGTGFAPPYAFPSRAFSQQTRENLTLATTGTTSPVTANATATSTGGAGLVNSYPPSFPPAAASGNGLVEINLGDGTKPLDVDQAVLDRYLETFDTRYPRPATVFCSRELEAGLVAFVRGEVASGRGFPDDGSLRARARSILGTLGTAADDEVLLGKFKGWVAGQIGVGHAGEAQSGVSKDPKTGMADKEMGDVLASMNCGGWHIWDDNMIDRGCDDMGRHYVFIDCSLY